MFLCFITCPSRPPYPQTKNGWRLKITVCMFRTHAPRDNLSPPAQSSLRSDIQACEAFLGHIWTPQHGVDRCTLRPGLRHCLFLVFNFPSGMVPSYLISDWQTFFQKYAPSLIPPAGKGRYIWSGPRDNLLPHETLGNMFLTRWNAQALSQCSWQSKSSCVHHPRTLS